MKTTYSQINQDTKIVNFYKEKRNGFFVDIGAFDGITLSNTFLLEKKYDWKGICVEPLVSSFKSLVKNRNVICINNAVYSKSGLTLKFSSAGLGSGITEHIDKHISNKNKEQVDVFTKTLTDILDENKAPSFIEYMSLDTEGTELEILKGTDFSKYIFGRIDIEHNKVEPRRTRMKQFLEKRGYERISYDGLDDNYAHKSNKYSLLLPSLLS